ncbi:MAG: EF-hand domain-containing protein [Verrucomicrobiaceae bacterium]|nr:EF-hand domain-containing protein [Verrucomicrobiaceae bacterium]
MRAFKNWDKNQDGHLTLEEYRNGLAKKDNVENRFKNFDKNSDGKVTREEFAGKAAP